MDAVSHILRTFRLRARVFHNARYCGAFRVDTSGSGQAAFHVVTAGRCLLTLPDSDAAPEILSEGDLVLLPRDRRHALVDRLKTPVAVNSTRSVPFDEAPADDGAGLVCGFLEFDQPSSNPLLDVLPDVVVVHSDEPPWNRRLAPLVRILVNESVAGGPGVQITLDRLSDVIFVLLIRERLARGSTTGLGAALADPRIGRCLDAIHDAIAEDWTVETMARVAAMSRTSFADRFKALLGETPMAYLTRTRMQAAHRWLRDERISIAEAGARTGYASEAAFAKAFKREMGVTPGAARSAR